MPTCGRRPSKCGLARQFVVTNLIIARHIPSRLRSGIPNGSNALITSLSSTHREARHWSHKGSTHCGTHGRYCTQPSSSAYDAECVYSTKAGADGAMMGLWIVRATHSLLLSCLSHPGNHERRTGPSCPCGIWWCPASADHTPALNGLSKAVAYSRMNSHDGCQ